MSVVPLKDDSAMTDQPTNLPRSLSDRLLARLSRVTSSGAFFAEIDGLRFIAIASVIVYHVGRYVPHDPPVGVLGGVTEVLCWLFSKGHFGVQLFFTISGLILGMPFAAHYLAGARAVSLRRYYARRVLRLEPPYMISLMICLILIACFPDRSPRIAPEALSLPHLAASVAYLHQFIFREIPAINGVLWSLECEVQFYMLAPFLAWLFRIRQPLWRRASILLLPLVLRVGIRLLGGFADVSTSTGLPLLPHVFGIPHAFLLRLILPKYIGFFAAGLLLADIYITQWHPKPIKHWRWDLVGMVGWVGLILLVRAGHRNDQTLLNLLVLPVLIAIAYTGCFRGVILQRAVSNRWVATLGGMCYTSYLYHQILLFLFFGPLLCRVTSHPVLQATLYTAIVMIYTSILFVLFEKPFMYRDWPQQWWAHLILKRRFLTRPRIAAALLANPHSHTGEDPSR